MKNLKNDLVGCWQAFTDKFPEFSFEPLTTEAIEPVLNELDDSMFRKSVSDDLDPEYLSSDDLNVGEFVWLGDSEFVVNQACAENWALQSQLENDVLYEFKDVARLFVLESVVQKLKALNGDED